MISSAMQVPEQIQFMRFSIHAIVDVDKICGALKKRQTLIKKCDRSKIRNVETVRGKSNKNFFSVGTTSCWFILPMSTAAQA